MTKYKPTGYLSIGNKFYSTLVLFLLHAPLSLLMKESSMISTVHAWGVLALGIFSIMRGKTENILFIAGYLIGAEVLWRMTDSMTFWEQGKYAIIFILSLTIFKENRKFSKNRLLLLYFFFLLPSVPLIFITVDSYYRNFISQSLSGPLCLFVTGTYFMGKTYDIYKSRAFLSWMIAPIVGVAFLCLTGMYKADKLVFFNDSSFLGSGGFGPNQVSSILGAGFLFLFYLTFFSRGKQILQLMWLIFLFWFLAQAMLTFSRGGVIVSIFAAAVSTMFLMKDYKYRKYAILCLLIIFVVSFLILLPRLNKLTGEKLSTRYQNYGTTSRYQILKMDIQLFLNNPILGVGPGIAKIYHVSRDSTKRYATHTEFSRMLAEHGIFGAISTFLLFLWLRTNIRKTSKYFEKAFVVGILLLGIGSMMHSAMRIAMIPFTLGLTAASFFNEKSSKTSI